MRFTFFYQIYEQYDFNKNQSTEGTSKSLCLCHFLNLGPSLMTLLADCYENKKTSTALFKKQQIYLKNNNK